MKFAKTAIAVAVAGFAAAPMMASAETTLSGILEIKVQGDDVDNSELDMAAGDVRVAINSQNEIVGGLTGYANIQFNLDDLTGEGGLNQGINLAQADQQIVDAVGAEAFGLDPAAPGYDPLNPFGRDEVNLLAPATVSSDNIYVGIKGGFGDLRLGDIPLAIEYGQIANDVHDVGETVADGFSYVGTFGPASVIGNYSLQGDDADQGDSNMAGIGAKFALAGVTFGLGYEARNLAGDGDSYGTIAAGLSFAIAGFSIGAHYWVRENENNIVQEDNQLDFNLDEDLTNYAVQVGYGIAGVNLGVTYSFLDNVENVEGAEEKILRVDAGYALGGGLSVSTRINILDQSGLTVGQDDSTSSFNNDKTDYRVMLAKTF